MEKIINDAIEMCKYANSKLDGIAKENFNFETDRSFCHHCNFRYFIKGKQTGACIEFGDHSNTYVRIFADKVTEYGGWCGDADIFFFNEKEETWINSNGKSASKCIFRHDMIRSAILKWKEIKSAIDAAVEREKIIENFKV